MTENKEVICVSLKKTLQATRQYSDLSQLHYYSEDNGEEYVVAEFRDGCKKKIHATACSGIALIKTVVRGLE